MGLFDDLAIILSSYSGGYRYIRSRIYGYRKETYPPDVWNVKEASIRVALSRLKRKGFVENRRGVWRSTKTGRTYATKLNLLPRHSRRIATKVGLRNLIITFDIPEVDRRKRNWLRMELKYLGFVKLQQSVWLGRAPLPGGFIWKLKELRLLACVEFFHANGEDVV